MIYSKKIITRVFILNQFFSLYGSLEQSITAHAILLHEYNDYKIYLSEHNNAHINAPIKKGLDSFNTQHIGILSYDHCTIVVKDTPNHIIAGAICDICRSNIIGEIGEFNGIWVKEQYKNKGIEIVIMNTLLDHIRKKNCSVVQIEAYGIQNNSKIKEFYQQFGFKTDAVIPEIDTIETYIMRLSLKNHIKAAAPEIAYNLEIHTHRNDNSDIIEKELKKARHKECSIITDQPYTIFITSIEGKIIGGAIGSILEYKNSGKSCKTSTVWVDEQYRNNGLGTKIINEVITYAINKQCKNIHLETYEWQAKPFYEKRGFNVVATAPNVQKMRNLEQYYMRKDLLE
ncbi:MAG TPA: GNAT family N-acetyltransferase [Candidatus Babeliales bacterium]|nr:GNAT family N-acetyltransferase [Candidatus Babeliales bacterium]